MTLYKNNMYHVFLYSFGDACDKVLDESIYGDFSTKPADIRLYMSDILKHVTSPFPMHLLMFKDFKEPKMLGTLHEYDHIYNQFVSPTLVGTEEIC